MARGFRRKKGRIVGELDPVERAVVLDVLRRTAELLEDDDPAPRPHAAPGRPGADEDAGGGPAGESDAFEAIMRAAGLTGAPAGASDDDAPAPEGERPLSDDPAIRRLLPDGHRDDPEAAAAFRRLSAASVRATKLTHLHRAADALEPDPGRPSTRVELGEDDAVALLRALTDVRLVLAERLELRSDDDVEHLQAQLEAIREGDERAQAMLAYDFLTWLQETLAGALLPG